MEFLLFIYRNLAAYFGHKNAPNYVQKRGQKTFSSEYPPFWKSCLRFLNLRYIGQLFIIWAQVDLMAKSFSLVIETVTVMTK